MVPELDPEQTVALELVDPATVLQLTQSATKHHCKPCWSQLLFVVPLGAVLLLP
jgi:hypothetical protein